MNPVQRLISDLVEKKLWPVALVLVVSAVAIPLLIGGGGSGAGAGTPDPSVALAPAVAAATPAVELVGPPDVRSRPGAVRDPFRRTKTEKAAPASSPSSPAKSSAKPSATGSSAKGADKSSGSSASDAKKPSSSKATPAVTKVALAARSSYQTVVRTTRPGGDRERPLHRLSVVGNPANPAVQYLGVGDDGEYAIFVLGPKATASGDDGACVVLDGCRVIGLRPGDKLGVDVAAADGTNRHYEVEVLRVRRLRMSAERATAWRKRVDPIGREVRDTLAKDAVTAAAVDRLRYSTTTGTIGLTSAP